MALGCVCTCETVRLGRTRASSSAPRLKLCMFLRVITEVIICDVVPSIACAVKGVCVSGTV